MDKFQKWNLTMIFTFKKLSFIPEIMAHTNIFKNLFFKGSN